MARRPGAKLGPTEVRIEFVDQGESTLVKVEHHEGQSQLAENWSSRAKGFSKAWDDVLPAFASETDRRES